MKKVITYLLIILFSTSFFGIERNNRLFAQRGKQGVVTLAANSIVNEYTALSQSASAGTTTITVASNVLNANTRFSGPLAPGDLIMIIQVQGVIIKGSIDPDHSDLGLPSDSTWGEVINYKNCGNWELAEVNNIFGTDKIILDCGLSFSYDVSSSERTEIIRVPRYNTLTLNAGATITCDTWNGTVGGISAIEVENNALINGTIDASGKGFRGGQITNVSNGIDIIGFITASKKAGDGGEKGESIAGNKDDYLPYGGRYCKGSPANAGGGGTAHNSGGGGGASAGTIPWTGHGNPDNSGLNWARAWDLQYIGLSSQTSSGGGQGGYSFSSNNLDATLVGPNNTAWGPNRRQSCGGFGGRPLDFSNGRLFLGGGGGAGDENDNAGGNGGNGGGLIYMMVYGILDGTGTIKSNGNNGLDATGGTAASKGVDGAGGAGAGGAVVLNANGGVVNNININVNGGNGGNQVITGVTDQAEGPGGGGGGGYIGISSGNPTRTANGGNNGTTNATGLKEFLPNGATKGGTGVTGGIIKSPSVITASDLTICQGQIATLTAAGGTSYNWYLNVIGGISVATGSTFTVSPVTTTTYYVGACPGTFRIPAIVTVRNGIIPVINSPTIICAGSSVTLTVSPAIANYIWNTGETTSSIVVSPTITTSYSVIVTNENCLPVSASTTITVTKAITPSINSPATICSGGSTILSASPAGMKYLWSTSETTSSVTVSPTATTEYSVTVSDGNCPPVSATTTVTVSPSINAKISGPKSICNGGITTLSASGGNVFVWSTGATTSSITISSPGNYSVLVSSGNCSSTTSTIIKISPALNIQMNSTPANCNGQVGLATATVSGGVRPYSYLWMPSGQTTQSITGITTSDLYSVLIIDSLGCTQANTVKVDLIGQPNAVVSGNRNLCLGDVTTLIASGGNTYLWNTGETYSSIIIAPTQSITYTLQASIGICKDTTVLTVTVLPPPVAKILGDTKICFGHSGTLASVGGVNYIWSTGETTSVITISPTSNTAYSVIVSVGSCSDKTAVNIDVLPTPTPTVTGIKAVCRGSATTLVASGGTSYLWNTGDRTSLITVKPQVTTIYSVTASDGLCTGTTLATVSVMPTPSAVILGKNSICEGTSASLTASGGGTYKWSTGNSNATLNTSVAGNYYVVVTQGSCADTAFATIKLNPRPTVSAGADIFIIQGQSTNLNASGGISYLWSNNMSGPAIVVSPPATTKYCVVAYDINQCIDTACVMVVVDHCTGNVYLPNAFSPNSDSENDFLRIYAGNTTCIKTLHIVIYDRWGEKVYESNDPAFQWDGVYEDKINKTQPAGTGVLTYYLKVETIDGATISKKGSISLMK